jgi:7,8-dihydropterin-6-yl-methyl-4-(beta-D-ribofuranosyl)aminobenzene 5'-phosphate synthase
MTSIDTLTLTDRRNVLRSGGKFVLSGFVSLLLLNNEVVQAETLRSAPAEIDYLSVRVVTDSYQIAVSPDSKAGSVEIQRFGFAVGPHPPERALLSEFGLSLFASS